MSTSSLSSRSREWLAGASPAWLAFGVALAAVTIAGFVHQPGLFVTQAVGGLVYGAILVLITLGLSLILGLMGVVNFAHGSLFMLGAYVSYSVVAAWGLPFWAALVVAPVIVGLVGVLVEVTVLRRLYGSEPIVGLLATFGLTMMIDEAIQYHWGTTPLGYSKPAVLRQSVDLGVTQVASFRLFMVAIATITVAAVYVLISRTDFGLTVRAGVQDGEMTEFVGVNLPVRFTAMFFLGSAIAALAGVLQAAEYGMNAQMGQTFLILAFVVVVVGGVGSLFGSVVAGIVIGEATYLTPVLLSGLASYSGIAAVNVSGIRGLVPYLVMLFILLVRPRGLFGEEGLLE
ncbi:branched-chain amino acid ABC transporter permease [Halorubellus sp. JP-L1]|uniref:branched-chain amino acid ABC transporter permease n=1 Tax=Halorubellus sp. JP-L1 TaxID=2715753 RepID=UPI00140CBE1B|nr:branched-chain amino acid ABC transporter permease [Halorubellus sp. JP-L1]NHN40949.1 branched-chain amino acid ABC transporter permease [Halorubellus sp. JP-L1]